MKKLTLLLTAFLIYSTTLIGQELNSANNKQHELRVTIGANLGIGDDEISLFGCYDDFNFQYYPSASYLGNLMGTPNINLSYHYQIKKWFTVGIIANFHSTWQNSYRVLDDAMIKKNLRRSFNVVPTIRFDWYRGKMVNVYVSLGMGVGYETHKNIDKINNKEYKNKYYEVAGEFIPFGMTVGKSTFGLFEIGVSTIGFVKVGIGHRF